MILLNIACNMQNMQNNMTDMQNMQSHFQYAEYAPPTLLMKYELEMYVCACICMYLLVLCQYLHVSAEGMWTPVFQGASATALGVQGPAAPRHCCSPPSAAARGPTPDRSRDPAAPCSTSTRGQGSCSPLFYINTWAMIWPTVTDYFASRLAGRRFEKNKIF